MTKVYHKDQEEVEMHVKKVVSTRIDEQGRTIQRFEWEKMTKPISLGSMRNPKNPEILGFDVVEKKKGGDIQGMMDGLFGGMK